MQLELAYRRIDRRIDSRKSWRKAQELAERAAGSSQEEDYYCNWEAPDEGMYGMLVTLVGCGSASCSAGRLLGSFGSCFGEPAWLPLCPWSFIRGTCCTCEINPNNA